MRYGVDVQEDDCPTLWDLLSHNGVVDRWKHEGDLHPDAAPGRRGPGEPVFLGMHFNEQICHLKRKSGNFLLGNILLIKC